MIININQTHTEGRTLQVKKVNMSENCGLNVQMMHCVIKYQNKSETVNRHNKVPF